jgi:hypothetical protein
MERRLHSGARMRSRYLLIVAALAAVGCHKRDRSGIVVGQASAGKEAERRAAAALAGTADEEMGGGNNNNKKMGGGEGTGGNRWKDIGVYVDGRPVGVVSFGELPIGLKPTWIVEEHSIEFEAGYQGPRTRKSYARRYRFVDYLKAVGVDVRKVKEIQVLGPKETAVIIASGKDLRSPNGQNFMFRFGSAVGGKAIPVVPDGFGNGVMPDKMSCVMVYIDKKPPTLVPDEGLAVDGKVVDGVPYYGEPMRGGVRVYVDDRLSVALKPQALDESPAETGADGTKHWKLASVLKQNGIDLTKIVEAWGIADERRKHKFTRAELDTLTFTLNPTQKNEFLIGDAKARVSALALHSHALAPDELPQIRPDEDVD